MLYFIKNIYNKIYNEVDGIISVEKEKKINNFIVFSMTKFHKKKNLQQ